MIIRGSVTNCYLIGHIRQRFPKRLKTHRRKHPAVEWISAKIEHDTFRQISFLTSLTNRSHKFREVFTIPVHVTSCDETITKEYWLHPRETEICPSLKKFSGEKCLFLESQGKKTSHLVFKNNSTYPPAGHQPTMINKEWISQPNRTSVIKMKREHWAAHSLIILSPHNKTEAERSWEPNSQPCLERTDKIIEGREEPPQILTFTHHWDETSKHCSYVAVLRFQNPCRKYITGEYSLLHRLTCPSEFMDDKPSPERVWTAKMSVMFASSLAAIFGITMVITYFHLRQMKIPERKGTKPVEKESAAEKHETGKQIHETKVLLIVYAPDVKEEVSVLMSNLRAKTSFEIIDLFDMNDLRKVEDPTIWLISLMMKPSVVVILVTSPAAKCIKERLGGKSCAGDEMSIRREDVLSERCRALIQGRDSQCLAEFLQMKSLRPGNERRDVTEILEKNTRQIHNSEPLSGIKTLTAVVPNPATHSTLKCEPHTFQGEHCPLISEPLHFLLDEFFKNMFSLHLADTYDRLYQVRLTISSSGTEMKDVTPGRIYLYPDHEDELVTALKGQPIKYPRNTR
ncbi:uncharacterized protein LOC135219559 isoform X1 [Macrobrachium nipponense]|uniref:uncharacterized protein LOC135219559 isoform X1 n=1 Tax=Macrobrachium nipponense TaxID=159736 RepID=UPI0030C85021